MNLPLVPMPTDARTFSPREISELLDMTPRAVRIRLQRESIKPHLVAVRGGLQQRVPFEVLPKDWQSHLARKLPELRPGLASRLAEVPAAIQSMAEWQRREVSVWVEVLQETWGMKGMEVQRRLVELEAKYPGVSMSYVTYTRKLNAFLEGGAEGLVPGWGKTRGRSKVDAEHFRVFLTYYLIEGGPALRDSHLKTFGHFQRQAEQRGQVLTMEEFGSRMAFKRLLDRAVSPSAQFFYRSGPEAWTRKYKSHIDRNPASVEAGELWVADHHQLDVGCNWDTVLSCIPGVDGEIRQVLVDKKGKPKPIFPWITVWRDFRSGKILSCLLHDDAPNSDHVIYSFYLACKRWGVPRAILLDNGKDFRCRAFSGGKEFTVRVDLSERDRSVCRALGVIVHFATPYNAKAKPIERDFRKFKEWFCLYLPGYRGGHAKERPERLVDEIKSGALFGHEELAVALHAFVERVLNRFPSQGKYLRGKSPDEYWDGAAKAVRQVEADELALCCMRATEPREVRGQGVHYAPLKLDYYADWMSTQGGRKVYLRLDLLNFTEAFVFDADTDKPLGRAQANHWQADALVKDEKASARLRALARAQGQQLKDLKTLGETLGLGVDHLEPVADAAAGLAALGVARGYTPTNEGVAALPAPMHKTALAGAAEANRTARKNKIPRKRLVVPGEANPVKRRLALFDSEREEASEAEEGPELKRAAR